MLRSRHRIGMLIALAFAALAASACGGDAPATKAGGQAGGAEPIVLRFGSDDFPGRAGADQVAELARRVAELTGGEVRIEGVWLAGREGDGRRWDQRVAQRVIDGDLDGANIPARAWDMLGVTSMRAFHAPFVITDEAAMNAVLSDATIAGDMLAGLTGSGVTGLAIAPDSIRYLFGFSEPFPLTTAAGFDGAVIRAPASATTWAVFEGLGATPDDIPDVEEAIADGSITAMESTFGLVDSVPNTSALGNLPLFPKANVLVVNDEAFARLSDAHRDALRAAAEGVRDWAIANNPTAAASATRFCTGEGSILHADATQIEALHERAGPALADLAADETVAATIDRIRKIAKGVTASPVPAACASDATPIASEPAAFDLTKLNGVYRFTLTADELRASGVSDSWIERNEFATSLLTITLADGTIEVTDRCASCTLATSSAQGAYTVSGSDVTFRIDAWSSHWTMTPTFTDDGITWTYVDSLPPWGNAEDKLVDDAFWTTHSWARIAA